MLEFECLRGPCGIPVFFQPMPGAVEAVGLAWVMFVGGADDGSVGANGLHHWFEHVPFRGTKEFPGGYRDTKGWLIPYAGSAGAATGVLSTRYWAMVPRVVAEKALNLITDLMSRPLLTQEGIEAERIIIAKEIADKEGSSIGSAFYQLPELLWPGHPLGHHVLGSKSTLATMSVKQLRRAHVANYDRSRTALFVCGNIDRSDLLGQLERIVENIPDHGLPPRRSEESYGPLPAWQGGHETLIETAFTNSVVMMLFPAKPRDSETLTEKIVRYQQANMLATGGLASPLYRILREDRKLVYSVGPISWEFPDGGFYGIVAKTERNQISEVCRALCDLLRDEELYSAARLEQLNSGRRWSDRMRLLDPMSFVNGAMERYTDYGRVIGDQELNELFSRVTVEDLEASLAALTPDRAHTIIFEGRR